MEKTCYMGVVSLGSMNTLEMKQVLNLTSYQALGIVYLDQLRGACHTHVSYHDRIGNKTWAQSKFQQRNAKTVRKIFKILAKL